MKKSIISLFIIALLTACSNDFITLNPPSDLNAEGFYKTQTDMNQAVLAAYGKLRDLYYNQTIATGEIRSDNTSYSWLAGNPISEKGIDELGTQLIADNSYTTGMWDNCYNIINRCNIVIGRTDAATFSNESLKAQYKAETRFLRALIYFWLNRVYGGTALNGELLGAIIVDKEISQSEAYELGRSPLQANYDFIVEDLKYASENLPDSYGNTDKGRVTKAGAIALLGKVYMFMAGYPLNKGTQYYQLAIDQFNKVEGISSVKLAASYKDLFDVTKKNSSESLFEIQYKKGTANGATGSPWNNNFAPRFSGQEVVLVGDKSGSNSPTKSMSNAYEKGDPRKFVCMREGYYPNNDPSKQFINEAYVCKYYDVATSGSDNGNNWIELRLGEILLLHAEALVRTTNSVNTEAIGLVNQIRLRARNTVTADTITKPANLLRDYNESDFGSPDALLIAIEQEMRVELAFENHRWFNLVRTKRAKTVMEVAQSIDGMPSFVWSDDMMAFPIPVTVMQSNPGKIIQNKGYDQL